MLTTLSIKNFVIIRDLTVDLTSGMTVITGETGSGKSILIRAIEIALGKRIEKQSILDQTKKCEISLTFDTYNNKNVLAWLKKLDLEQDDNEIIIRRVMTPEGRSKNYLNSTLINLSTLKEFTKQIINIHGQHENQLILHPDSQLRIVDNYGNYPSLLIELENLYIEWKNTKAEIMELANSANSQAKIELLNFQIDEIEKLSDIILDFKNLEKRHSILINSEEIQQACNKAIDILDHEEKGSINQVQNALNELSKITKVETSELTDTITCLKDSMIQLSEASTNLHNFNSHIEHNPKELFKIDNQLQKIYDIAKKHRIYPCDLAQHLDSLKVELEKLQNKDKKLSSLQKKLISIEQNYRDTACQLSQLRQQSATEISKKVTKQLILLDICGPFNIKIDYDELGTPHRKGSDKIEFFIKTNPDAPSSSIEKIASGGELSRISLAVQAVIGKHFSIPTMIFDEVDVGISGSTAEIVGKLLINISAHSQIICITHLAQVASLAHQHLKVTKLTTGCNTETNVFTLDHKERVKEVARILGGIKVTEKTLQHAKEMVSQ